MGTTETNDDGALGLPLVALGPDSTRRVDNLTTWGVVLWRDEDGSRWEYRSSDEAWYWSPDLDKWMVQYNPNDGFDTKGVIEANPPTCPPPGFVAAAVIADEQRMADVFREAMLAVAALRSGCGLLDEVSRGMGNQPRYRTSLLMEAAADSLESAIARANGGAE